ncbi:hypothetical protein D3C81_1409210 [compost metagenome]
MGADDDDAAAPDQERRGGIEDGGNVAVKCRLVDDDLTLQAANAGRVAGQRNDLETGGVADAVSVDLPGVAGFVLVIEQKLFNLADAGCLSLSHHAAELGAIADELQAFLFRVADVETVHAARRLLRSCSNHGVQRLSKGDAGAAAFFAKFDLCLYTQPVHLVRHQYPFGDGVVAFRDLANAWRKFIPFNDAQCAGRRFHCFTPKNF